MKKKLLIITFVMFLSSLFLACSSCAGVNITITNPQYYTLTFIQEGQEDIIKQVKKGEALADIPEPVAIPGYNVSWSITDFSEITSNLTVTIMKEAKTFKVYYSLGVLEGYEQVSISENTKDVFYNANFTLTTPSCIGYEFLGWVLEDAEDTDEYFYGGTYTYLTDITVTAMWKLIDEDLGWSGLH